MDELEQNLELELEEAESNYGMESAQVVECLEEYAKLLRQRKTRLLDAVNMEARAQVIRSKLDIKASQKDTQVASASKNLTSVEEPSETKLCPFCAETIKSAAIKCRFCGSDLESPNRTTTANNVSTKELKALGNTKICLACGFVGPGVSQEDSGCFPVMVLLGGTLFLIVVGLAFWPIWLLIPILWVWQIMLDSSASKKPRLCSKCKGNVIPINSPEGQRLLARSKERK